MRKLIILFTIGLLSLAISGVAGAAPLNWAGTWTLDMTDFGRGSVTGGGVATVNGSAGVVPAHLSTLRLAPSRGHIAGTFMSIVTDPDSLAGNGIGGMIWEDVEGGTGTLGAISGGAASTAAMTPRVMPIRGVTKICLLTSACTLYLELPFTEPTTVNGVPGTGSKGLGIGGFLTVGGYGGIRMSLYFAPWTIKTLTVTDHITTTGGERTFIHIVQKGWAHAPASTTSSTDQPGGMVQLVTPNQVLTNLPVGANAKVGSSVMLLIRFIPEPGLLLLLGTGVAGLAMLGRNRLRR